MHGTNMKILMISSSGTNVKEIFLLALKEGAKTAKEV